jgi:hypothetical protein
LPHWRTVASISFHEPIPNFLAFLPVLLDQPPFFVKLLRLNRCIPIRYDNADRGCREPTRTTLPQESDVTTI